MIKYTLKCSDNHMFDSWFQSADAFDKLVAAKMVTCSVCGVLGVEKAIMAPKVRTARNAAKTAAKTAVQNAVTATTNQAGQPTAQPAKKQGPLSAPASPAEQALSEMRRMVESNSENVGDNFAQEARAIHDGDAPSRSIYGQAKPDEAKSLIEDGVPVVPLPWGQKKTN